MIAFSASGAGPSKKAPKWPPGALPRSLPGPPGDLLAGPRRPKEAPRAAQEPPRPPQEPPRSASRAVLAAIWRPTAAQEVPRGLQEAILASSGLDFRPSGGRFLRPRPLHLQPSGKHFRLLLGLSRARPQKPKKPGNAKTRSPPTQANHDMSRKCENKDPANRGDPNNRWPRSAWLTKGGRRCWRSHSQYNKNIPKT